MSNRDTNYGRPTSGAGRIFDITARIAAGQRPPLGNPETMGCTVWTCANAECGLTNPMSKGKCRFCGEVRGGE